ncbi:hypothetical protein [Alteromonas mediterranea]|jgi:hypothetical protein|uniref:Uncharacterized protein n=1 Tax=Alteromonas mediterranea TaxID=314275 RepID=A0AAC8XJ91_9ALTE|nr:hypothetical protein [Alteromonas mediterranea]AFV85285.1 hypothetical protein amad1_08870 [Alteromonas mediterranea DE1]AGP97296.1 hypothetical protein I635_08860 [Alteromonas mediterranea UM7]AMJ78380.1 hypothetical protein AV942_08775 [Alteromonas mediterranea]AMJ82529.1 hypothetical protein AV941_08810 [Alteromonas mediterranea]
MSLVDGFRQGFGMMSDYYNRQDTKEYRQEQLGLQNRRMNMAEESHKANMQTSALNRTLLQGQVDDMPAATQHTNTMRGLQVRGQQLSVDGKETQNEINDFKLSSAKTNQAYKVKGQSNKDAIEKYQAYAASQDWAGFVTDPVFKGTNIEPLQNVQGADAAIKISEAMEKNDIKTVVDQSNVLFKSKLNRNVGKMEGRKGGTIKDITIIDFAQQPDGSVKVPVRVTTDNGVYNSFISEMRGIDPNDPDKVFTADDLYGTAASMGQLAGILKSSGIYEQMQGNANRYLAPKSGRGNGIPAKVQEMEYTRRLLGDEQYKQWLMFGRGKSPQELGMAAYKLASDTLEGVYFDSPEEKKAAVDQMTTELVSKFSQPTQSGQGGTPQPAPGAGQYSQVLQQAAAAIQSGKDRDAVIQRLVDMGVPQDQINL